jgi:hypothetical protein
LSLFIVFVFANTKFNRIDARIAMSSLEETTSSEETKLGFSMLDMQTITHDQFYTR